MKAKPRELSSPNRPLEWFSYSVLAVILLLLYAGAFTTTIKAGMVFPDWPLSNGSINPPGWLTNQAMFAEHSHRLLGSLVGVLCIILAVWLARVEPRRWVRALGWIALGLVILQGLLGGKRVLLDSIAFAGVHGFFAQTFLCLMASIALTQSRLWHGFRIPANSAESERESSLRRVGIAITLLLFVQLFVAVTMRHMDAGLAIRTFPLVEGSRLWPAVWDLGIFFNYTHRVLAGLLFAAIVVWTWRIFSTRHVDSTTKLFAGVNFFLLFVQIGLGAATVWMERLPIPTTLHVVNGALLLATTWGLTFLFCKTPIERRVRSIRTARPSTLSVSGGDPAPRPATVNP